MILNTQPQINDKLTLMKENDPMSFLKDHLGKLQKMRQLYLTIQICHTEIFSSLQKCIFVNTMINVTLHTTTVHLPFSYIYVNVVLFLFE